MEILDEAGPTAVAAGPKAGDEVNYVPDMIYAKQRDAEGDYPWRLGRLGPDNKSVVEVPSHEIEVFLMGIRRQAAALMHQNPGNEDQATEIARRQCVLIAPAKTWKGLIRQIHPDGTADVDVYGANSAITLHMRKIKRDETAKEPHTFHQK